MSHHGIEAVVQVHDDRQDWLASEREPEGGDSADTCLAAMVEAVGGQLHAEALRVDWFTAAGASVLLHMNDRCRADAGIRLLLQAHAVQMANPAERDLLARKGLPLHDKVSALAFPAGDGIVTITAVLKRERSVSDRSTRLSPDDLTRILQPFFELWAASQSQRSRMRGLACVVENCGIATFLVDQHSTVLFANTAGKALAAQASGISLVSGRLAATALADTMRLQAVVAHVCGCATATARILPVVALQRSGGQPLIAAAAPVPPDRRGLQEGSAVLYIFDAAEDVGLLLEPACKLYGLSAGETRLTCRLANGKSLAEAARAIGVREQTARSYLKQIFLKTQTNRQGELVSLMLKSAVRVANAATTRVF